MPRTRRFALILPAILTLLAAACGKGPAYGSDNALIAVVDPALRDTLDPVIRGSFERTFFTTRPEPVFDVTFESTRSIGEFRKWKRIVVFEPADEEASLVPQLLTRSQLGAARSTGVVAVVEDKWARGQSIWVISGPTAQSTLNLARATADSLFEIVQGLYVDAQVERMWASGRDVALADSMLREHGFSITLPRVYRGAPASAPPRTLTYFNQEPRRVVSIHWAPRPAEMTRDTVLGLRREWGRAIFPGDTIPARIPREGDVIPEVPDLLVGERMLGGRPAVRLQGVWQNPSDHSGGVFLTYGVPCGEHLVLLDGNVFAPDRPKYPYVVQLEQIFETFRCARER